MLVGASLLRARTLAAVPASSPASCARRHHHHLSAALAEPVRKRRRIRLDGRRHESSAAAAAAAPGPAARFDELVRNGTLKDDDFQRGVVGLLQKLHDEIVAYKPPDIPEPKVESRSFFSRFQTPTPTIPPIPDNVPKGMYLFGDVGCGKTMLMDILYETLQAPNVVSSKRRVHFHAFMIDVHKRVGADDSSKAGVDVIVPIARALARDARVLCFDEFQVTDIVDAMILRRLLEALLGYGVVIIMTSNRRPDDLYKNGIQRKSFLPAIELIKTRHVVKDLDSDTDYRKLPRALSKVYYHPIDVANTREFDKLFDAQTAHEAVREDAHVEVWGRKLKIPRSSSAVAEFTFAQLCNSPLSAADYIEVTRQFETIFVRDIPQLTLSERDQARRFILFIDACYESKTKLFTLSDVPIMQIFSDKKQNEGEITAHMRATMDELGISADEVGASSLFTGEDEIFSFARAVSRLSEMGSTMWVNAHKAGSK